MPPFSMNTGTGMMKSITLAFALILFAAPSLRAQSAEEIFERMRSRYESLSALEAAFEQTSDAPYFDAPSRLEGTILMSGARYRLESGTRTFATDGETLWILDLGEGQLLINDYIEDGSTFSIHEFLYRFDDRYRFTGSSRIDSPAGPAFRLDLEPLDPADLFISVQVIMRASDDLITQVTVVDANEVTMTFNLTEMVQNPPISDDLFRIEAPEGTEVVDLRS